MHHVGSGLPRENMCCERNAGAGRTGWWPVWSWSWFWFPIFQIGAGGHTWSFLGNKFCLRQARVERSQKIGMGRFVCYKHPRLKQVIKFYHLQWRGKNYKMFLLEMSRRSLPLFLGVCKRQLWWQLPVVTFFCSFLLDRMASRLHL